MTSTDLHPQGSPTAPALPGPAEAARYALLRRLAPSFRHHLVVNLQPIGMVYEVMDRRLRMPAPDLADVREGAHKINAYARAALDSCLDVVTWLAPEEGANIGVPEGVMECLSLLTTSLTFRGYAVRNQVPALPGRVRRSALRNVLTGAMVYLTDEGAAPADLAIAAQAGPQALLLTLTLQPTDAQPGFSSEAPYRRLRWSDLEALALAESVQVTRDGSSLRLAIAWVGGSGS